MKPGKKRTHNKGKARKKREAKKDWLKQHVRGPVVVLLAVFALQAITSMVRKCPTSDENVHLSAGYTHLVTGDLRLNPEDPPLVKSLAALLLFCFSPNILAHGRLVNSDMGLAFFSLLALYCLDRALRRMTPLRVVLAGITLGLALLSKFLGPCNPARVFSSHCNQDCPEDAAEGFPA